MSIMLEIRVSDTLWAGGRDSDGKGFWGIASVLFPAVGGWLQSCIHFHSIHQFYRSDLHALYITQKMFS